MPGLLLAVAVLVGCSDPAPVDPVPDRAILQSAVEAVNAAAAGPVDTQQQLLRSLIDPAFAAAQQACAPATVTVRFDPVWSNLAPVPPATDAETVAGAAPSAAADPVSGGTVYRVPALVEVYTGPIRTGTDLTSLELSVVDGVAHTLPLCLV